MANLRDIRKRRKGATNTRKITRTMELVSSAKLKKAQDAANASYPFARTLYHLMAALSSAMSEADKHPLMKSRPVKKATIYLMASDRGLCGSFNGNLVNKALERARHHRSRRITPRPAPCLAHRGGAAAGDPGCDPVRRGGDRDRRQRSAGRCRVNIRRHQRRPLCQHRSRFGR